ncbi:hypothetical protein [Falsiroseomonas sp. CW058]|uniref:hypothetical protein n=1 Tax=Falsiroseomonas sp. CW058 TaxID=3388664 RepID=UPI003D323890
MTDEAAEFRVARQDRDDGAPGATAAFPYDRMTVERFREAFPRARWRDDLGAWFVPGTRAERRLNAWMSRAWQGVLAHADGRGRDALAFEPITSPHLDVTDDGFVVRTPYSRAVIAELREVPWARWDPASKAWRVPFRAVEELRRRLPAIEEAARHAEPEARRQRAEARRTAPGHDERRAEEAERRRRRYPVPEDAPPPQDRVLMTHAGPVVFEAISGEPAEAAVVTRFYPGIGAAPAALTWAAWRRPSHAELVQAWPARTPPAPSDLARGWWQPTVKVLREERRKAASLERAQATRRSRAR